MPTFSVIKGEFSHPKSSLQSLIGGGINSVVDFSDIFLTSDEIDYLRLVSFLDKVIIARNINSGLTFRDSVIKMLKYKQAAKERVIRTVRKYNADKDNWTSLGFEECVNGEWIPYEIETLN